MKIHPKMSAAMIATLLAAMTAPASAFVGPISPVRRPPAPPGWAYDWVGPVYQTVNDRVWIADRIDWQADWVEIAPGRMERVWRQCVIPGHWEVSSRRVLVQAGYWRLIRLDPPAPPYNPGPFPPGPWPVEPTPMPRPRPIHTNPGTTGVEGYHDVPTEDLSRFTPLREWPK